MTAPAALFFAEDTGAANYLAGMPEILGSLGLPGRMLASPHAARHFERLQVAYQPAPEAGAATTVIKSLRPRLIVVGPGINLDSVGLELLAAARESGIESVGIVDQRQNLSDRFRGRTDDPLSYTPDWILVPDPVSSDYFVHAGSRPDQVIVCGHPHFDRIYQIGQAQTALDRHDLRRRLLPNCPDAARIVTFAAEPARRVRGSVGAYRSGPDYTLTGRGGAEYRTDVVLEEFLDAVAAIDRPIYKVLRLHPHDPQDREFSAYYDEFDQISVGGLPHELILASDLVVGMSSMLLIEAALLGRATLSIVPRPQERSMLLSVEAGLTPCVHTRHDLHALLPRLLDNARGIDLDEVRDVFPPNSTARVREFFAARLGNERVGSSPPVPQDIQLQMQETQS